jgi:hypothetical protein
VEKVKLVFRIDYISYGFTSLAADVGGGVGMLLGASVLSF